MSAPDFSGAFTPSLVRNAFTVDVEDWFQVAAFSSVIDRKDWDRLECRVERNVDQILHALDDHKVTATFFTLGWIADRYPQMVQRIVGQGHELASHGYGHHMVHELSETAFKEDVVRAKGLLESISGQAVLGYRAPSFSIGPRTLWALDVLAATGHRYSSSIYPIRHDLYGMPEAPRFAHERSGLLEIPATSVRWMGRNWPASAGGISGCYLIHGQSEASKGWQEPTGKRPCFIAIPGRSILGNPGQAAHRSSPVSGTTSTRSGCSASSSSCSLIFPGLQ